MELEYREDRAEGEPRTAERSEPGKQAALTMPFASEGLEQLRDSHC